MAGFTWTAPPQDVWPPGAAAYAAAIRRAVYMVMQRYQAEIEAWMKTNAEWIDRTGNLRQALHSEVEPASPAEIIDIISLVIAHGLYYGYYLEGIDPEHNFAPTRLGWKYAIVTAALDEFGPRVWADIQKLLS